MSGPTVERIRLDQIDCSGRLRRVDEAAVEKLALSMQEGSGENAVRRQINPIILRVKAGGGFTLVAGAHRKAAAEKLGWEDISAIIIDVSDDDATLTEVDENLYRKDLNGAERSLFVTKKLELHIFSGGIFKRGKPLGKGATVAPLDGDKGVEKKHVISFYAGLEKQFGIKPRTAKRLVRRGRNISPALWQVILAAKKDVPDGLLDKLAALSANGRAEVERLVLNNGTPLAKAIKICSPKKNSAPSVEAVLRAVDVGLAAWEPEQRRQFFQEMKARK